VVTIKLTEDQVSTLMMALGYQMGSAAVERDTNIMDMILNITNVIGVQVPGFIPYGTPGEAPEDPLERPEERI